MILQTPKNKRGEMETMKVLKNGKVLCGCLANLYLSTRDYESVFCKHIKKFLLNFPNLEEYEEIKK